MSPRVIHAPAPPQPEQALHDDALRAPLAAPRTRVSLRVFAGIAFVLHGLGHAVLPYRGAGCIEATLLSRTIGEFAWVIALVGFVAAGVGVLGARPWRRVWTHLALASTVASVVAIVAFRSPDLWPGLVVDAIIAWAVRTPARTLDLVPPPRTRPRRAAWLVRDAGLNAFLLYVAATAVLRPWLLHWGTTPAEIAESLPGDPPDRDARFERQHAVTIDAPPSEVWPWLVGLGQHGSEDVRPGDVVRAPAGWLLNPGGVRWTVALVEKNRVLALRGFGALVLDPEPNGKTRLILRGKASDPRSPVLQAAVSFVFDVPRVTVLREMLLRIKHRAEHPVVAVMLDVRSNALHVPAS